MQRTASIILLVLLAGGTFLFQQRLQSLRAQLKEITAKNDQIASELQQILEQDQTCKQELSAANEKLREMETLQSRNVQLEAEIASLRNQAAQPSAPAANL